MTITTTTSSTTSSQQTTIYTSQTPSTAPSQTNRSSGIPSDAYIGADIAIAGIAIAAAIGSSRNRKPNERAVMASL